MMMTLHSAEITGHDDDVDKCTAESVKEAHNQITTVALLKPILKNCERTSHVK